MNTFIIFDDNDNNIKIGNCFICPLEWAEESKRDYTEWLAGQPDSHPSKQWPEPWLLPTDPA